MRVLELNDYVDLFGIVLVEVLRWGTGAERAPTARMVLNRNATTCQRFVAVTEPSWVY